MSNVLVAYESKAGSTEEIAEAIAYEISAHGHNVTCTTAETVDDVQAYDAVVLGSAVYIGRWRRRARRFLKRQGRALSQRPFWIFSSGPVGETDPDNEGAARWSEPPKIVERAEELGARGHVVFGGRVPAEPHGFVQRSMAENTPDDKRDLRDWREIRSWAAGIAETLPR